MKLYYDFHIHSCLSPCGDDDSTPNNIVNMALIKGLNVIALSDHNTGKNCPAAMAVGKKNGLVVLPAMELTTSEDIHILCLFEKYENLAKLENHIQSTRLKIKNKPEVFGHQRILDENDEQIGEEEHLLIVSSGVSVEEAAAVCGLTDIGTNAAHWLCVALRATSRHSRECKVRHRFDAVDADQGVNTLDPVRPPDDGLFTGPAGR